MENKNILGRIKSVLSGEIAKPIIVLTAICLIASVALSVTNYYTKDIISDRAKQDSIKAMQNLIVADSYETLETASEYMHPVELYTAYKNETEGKTAVGYIAKVSVKGYGGDVSVMTAVSPDLTVIGISVLDASSETVGLGQNVTKESFYSQFSGLKNNISLVKNGAKAENNEINAVTGATISSKAVKDAVNTALDSLSDTVFIDNQKSNESEVA